MEPTKYQKELLDWYSAMIERDLRSWPRQSGKTTFRKMLAERIVAEDDAPTKLKLVKDDDGTQ
jgi:hypothetical protein